MDGFKDFYNNRNGKAILFFGFYLLFFGFLAIYIRNINANKLKDTPKEETNIVEKITSYDLSDLINNDYAYKYVIVDYDEVNDNSITFIGTKNNIDYANFENKYFLDIYNINQLLKRSKLINSENYVLTYELLNKDIDDILLTNSLDRANEIMVYVNEDGKVEKINLNLAMYMNKDNYQILIDYNIGEDNEDSSS